MKGLVIFIMLVTSCLHAQVGINTTDPQQTLHIGYENGWLPTIGRMRVESLNKNNNTLNGGDMNGDGNPANDFYPLYVDENGDFTLEFKPMFNSGDMDALNDTDLPTSAVYLPSTDANGEESTEIVSYTFTVNRPTILEVKYNMSFDVYFNPAKDKITDDLNRCVTNWLKVSGTSRKYGICGNNYTSGSVNSVTGTLHNSSTAYISLPSANTYVITLVGQVRANQKAGGNIPGDETESTYVEFATGHDFIFFRMH